MYVVVLFNKNKLIKNRICLYIPAQSLMPRFSPGILTFQRLSVFKFLLKKIYNILTQKGSLILKNILINLRWNILNRVGTVAFRYWHTPHTFFIYLPMSYFFIYRQMLTFLFLYDKIYITIFITIYTSLL